MEYEKSKLKHNDFIGITLIQVLYNKFTLD